MVSDMYVANRITQKEWDKMLAEGWRHNGRLIFRTSHDYDEKKSTKLCFTLTLSP